MGISKVLLDAKRSTGKSIFSSSKSPNKDTATFFDNSLPKYKPLIDIDPLNFLGNGVAVLGVEKIYGTYTRLESTSVVLAHGIDVLYTTRCPSGRFDRIGDRFNKYALISTILILFISTRFAKYFANLNKLKSTWR